MNPFAGQLLIEANWFRSLRITNEDAGRATFSKEFDVGKWGNYRAAALGEYRKVFRGTTESVPIWVDASTGRPAFNATPAEAQAVAQPAQWSRTVGRTKTMGVAFHPTRQLSFYYNRADNVGPPGWGRRVLPPDGKPGNIIPPPSVRGEGEDIGFALSLLDGRIHTRATYYTTKAKNDGVTRPAVPQGSATRIADALQAAGIISQQERDIRIDLSDPDAPRARLHAARRRHGCLRRSGRS